MSVKGQTKKSKQSDVELTLRSQRRLWVGVSRQAHFQSEQVARKWKMPGQIWLLGEGSSRSAAEVAAEMLRRSGLRRKWSKVQVHALSAAELLGTDRIQKGDWVFGITHRGGTQTVASVLEQAREAGARTVRVVSAEATASVLPVDVVLLTGPLEKVEPHTEALTTAVCALTQFLGEPASWLQFWKSASRRKDPSLSELRLFLKSSYGKTKAPSVLLAHGSGESLMKEFQLKLLEMSRHPTWLFSSETFFHGPQWALGAPAQAGAGKREKLPILWWREEGGVDPRWEDLTLMKAPARGIAKSRGAPMKAAEVFFESLVECHWLALAVTLNFRRDPDARGFQGQ